MLLTSQSQTICVGKQQEDAKAREDLLRQRQLELEAALKEQATLIAQLMNKQPNP